MTLWKKWRCVRLANTRRPANSSTVHEISSLWGGEAHNLYCGGILPRTFIWSLTTYMFFTLAFAKKKFWSLLQFGLNLNFWISSFGLHTWALFWFSPKWLPSPFTTSLDLSFIIILLWNIFLLRKIFIFTLKMEYFDSHSKASPLFLSHKNLRKITHTPFGQCLIILCKNIKWSCGPILLGKIICILTRKCSLYSKCIIPWSFGAQFSWASLP